MLLKLDTLKPEKGAKKAKKRLGRGHGSGLGKTSGKGHKGQKARANGIRVRAAFEGGQTPLIRRIPKFQGFKNLLFKNGYTVLNVKTIQQLFKEETEITKELLLKKGIINKLKDKVKILADGDITSKKVIYADKFSKVAKEKIEKAGGEAKLC